MTTVAALSDLAPTPPRPRAAAVPLEHVDDLLGLRHDQLTRLYERAEVPRLADVRGDLRGRMLHAPVLREPVASLVRAFAGSSSFPWRGKSFAPKSEAAGEGINRVISDRWRWYRFETSVARSKAGAFDAVQLDYDLPENPFFIRAIEDEIRELSAGLWLGQAWLRVGRAAHFGLWFGLERP